jgi:hypothetical protein
MRVVYAGRVFDIVAVYDPDGGQASKRAFS